VPDSKPLGEKALLSGTDEKDVQRQRYEAAQRRVVSDSSAPPSKIIAIPSDDPIPYDQIFPLATSSVLSSATNSPAAGSSSLPRSATVPNGLMSPLDEKQQMRMYYAAKEKVDRGAQGGSSTQEVQSPLAAQSSALAPSALPPPTTHLSAADEKELMRKRYEDATKNVARTQGPSTPGPSVQSNSGPSGSSKPPAPAFLSAEQEKDMMRKRYEEATTNVARAQGGGPSTAASAASTPPPPIDGPSGSGGAQSAQKYLSAEQEKDLMKKRYEEATNRVSRTREPISPPPPIEVAGGSNGVAPKPVPYMSAEQEKDMMRRRYEEATQRVSKVQGVGLSTNPSDLPPPINAPSGSSSAPLQPYLLAQDEKESKQKRYEEATSTVTPSPYSNSSDLTATDPPIASGSRALPPQGPLSQKGYMSAAEEKDLMKKRYEEATSRVATASAKPLSPAIAASPPLDSPPPFSPITGPWSKPGANPPLAASASINGDSSKIASNPEPHPSTAAAGQSGSTNPAQQGSNKDPPDSRTDSIPPSNGQSSPPGTNPFRQSQAKSMSSASNPTPSGSEDVPPLPPPLPARPPADYINLLSPTFDKGFKSDHR